MTDINAGITFPLPNGAEFQGTTYSELTARRPKNRDMRLLMSEKDSITAQAKFFAQLCQVPPGVIEEIDVADFAPMQEWLTGFLQKTES